MSLNYRLKKIIASLPWTPSRHWFRSIILAPLALLFGLYWGLRKIGQHRTAFLALMALAAIVYGIYSIDLFADEGSFWIWAAFASAGAIVAAFILADWIRDRLTRAGLLRKQDPRTEIAVRRFHLTCEQERFSPSTWHAGYDNDMFGIGIELYTKRLLIWKHGQAGIFPLSDCRFTHKGHDLYVVVNRVESSDDPDQSYQFRISCEDARPDAREWERLLKKASRR